MDQKSIFIAKIELPNDPNSKSAARQYLVIEDEESYFLFLTTSSILGKEDRVFGAKGLISGINTNVIINDRNMLSSNGFNAPTFIDCSKRYRINKESETDFKKLHSRNLSESLWSMVQNKIQELDLNSIEVSEYLIDDIQNLKRLNWKL